MRSSVATYGLTLVAVLAAWMARWVLDPWLGDQHPFVTFYVAIVVGAWLGGWRPALLAAATGFVLSWYFFVPTRDSFELKEARHIFGLAMYWTVSLVFSGFGEVFIRARRHSDERGERMRTTLASIGDAVITTDLAGRITNMNPVAESLTAWGTDEAEGQPLDAVFRIENEKTHKAVESPAMRALREGTIVGLANHTVLIARDGTARPIDDSAAPIRCAEGKPVGSVLVFRDVTERRRLEDENASRLAAARLLASIVESSEDAIVSKTLDGTIQTWNAAAQRMFGYTAEQVVGRHITILIPVERRDEEDRIIARIQAGERIEHFDTVRQRQDGEFIPVSLTISPIRNDSGEVIGASKIARDITARKQSEMAMRKLAADLSDANRRKEEFLATLAHELRGPLAPLSNAVNVLKSSHGDGEAVDRARDMMDRQLKQMVRLVDDLLDLSRINTGRLELRKERVDLASIIRYAAESCRSMAVCAGHELTVDVPSGPLHLHGDAVRLTQVFTNLLNNACKYSDPGSTIDLRVEQQGTEWVASVKDAGIGIPPDKLDTIFEMFSQVDQALERSQGGLGIGLSLVRRLVELHGGTISAHSEGVGMGSEFVVRLPVLMEQHPPPVESRPEEKVPAGTHRVLIVDDNRDSAESLAMLLGLTGHVTHLAHDGEEAVAEAARLRPDVILLDIGLPKLNGYEVCRRIREEPWGGKVLIIALSGWGQDEDKSRSREAGFSNHLVKPVDYAALTKLLSGVPASKG